MSHGETSSQPRLSGARYDSIQVGLILGREVVSHPVQGVPRVDPQDLGGFRPRLLLLAQLGVHAGEAFVRTWKIRIAANCLLVSRNGLIVPAQHTVALPQVKRDPGRIIGVEPHGLLGEPDRLVWPSSEIQPLREMCVCLGRIRVQRHGFLQLCYAKILLLFPEQVPPEREVCLRRGVIHGDRFPGGFEGSIQ